MLGRVQHSGKTYASVQKKSHYDASEHFESTFYVEIVVKLNLGKCSALLTVHSCQLCTTGGPLVVRVHYCDKVESTN